MEFKETLRLTGVIQGVMQGDGQGVFVIGECPTIFWAIYKNQEGKTKSLVGTSPTFEDAIEEVESFKSMLEDGESIVLWGVEELVDTITTPLH